MRIATVFLDIGGVLIGLDNEPALKRISEFSRLEVQEFTRRLNENSRIAAYEAGELTTEEFFEHHCELLEMKITLEEFKEIWSSVFVFDSPANGMVSPGLFEELKRNCRLIALSNTNEMQFTYLVSCHPLVGQFHDQILSYQMGCLKPDPEIYRLALHKAGCSPSATLFVDDLPENVEAARRLGIQGVLFEGEEKLRRELKILGLL